MHRLIISSLALVFSLPTAWAQFEDSGGSASTTAELVSEAKTIAPGSTFTVALKLSHPQGWHSYYQNPGSGSELTPEITWTLPEGFTAGPIQWPTPEVKDGLFGKVYVYAGSPIFLVDLKAPANLAAGKTITLTANASWQICEDTCRDEKKSFTLTLPAGPTLEKDPAVAALFEKAHAGQPAKAPNWKFSAESSGADILLHVVPDTAIDKDPEDFVSDQKFVLPVSAGGSIKKDGKGWLVTLKRATKDAIMETEIPQGKSFSGILTGARPVIVPDTVIAAPGAGAAVGAKPAAAEVKPAAEAKSSAVAKPAAATSHESLSLAKYLPVLGGMLLGGLILNLMPCVFPVIGLKIMGFVQQAGSDRKKIAFHGLTFALGVLVSFGVLSSILFAMRATIGWGYQLQNPWVVLTLMLLMFVMALNMFGVFEMGTSATSVGGSLQSKHGLAGSFFSGVLATVVATPCSAPFLGSAIGATIDLPAAQFFCSFTAMAVGLALPYLILSVFPHLISYLPRPGAWMESFKQAMSFLLFATAGYLLWVYSGLIDVDNLLSPIFGLSAIAVAAWIHGRWNLPHRARHTRVTALVLTLVFATGGIYLAKPPVDSAQTTSQNPTTTPNPTSGSASSSALTWEPWSESRVEAILKEKKAVYIDFTAKWCATCQLNKKRAYTEDVVDLMHKKGVVTLKGDKTKPNPEIEAALKKLGRTAIPVNVLLVPGKEPMIFSEILSPSDLISALNQL